MSTETKMVTPQHLTSLQLLYQIQKTYVLLDDYDQTILERFGLNSSQYRALLLFDQERGKRLTTISERLLLSKSTITRVIDELEENGWVERIPDPEDRRAQRVVLTPRGLQKRNQVCAAHQQALSELFHPLSSNEKECLEELLAKLCNYLQTSLDQQSIAELSL
jgi:DNA-binding MarR family transcriptional regulator